MKKKSRNLKLRTFVKNALKMFSITITNGIVKARNLKFYIPVLIISK